MMVVKTVVDGNGHGIKGDIAIVDDYMGRVVMLAFESSSGIIGNYDGWSRLVGR